MTFDELPTTTIDYRNGGARPEAPTGYVLASSATLRGLRAAFNAGKPKGHAAILHTIDRYGVFHFYLFGVKS
jgi:hypothetical protein